MWLLGTSQDQRKKSSILQIAIDVFLGASCWHYYHDRESLLPLADLDQSGRQQQDIP